MFNSPIIRKLDNIMNTKLYKIHKKNDLIINKGSKDLI